MFRNGFRLAKFAAACVLALLSFSPAEKAFAADDNEANESWQVMYLAGKRVGFGRVVTWEVSRGRDKVFVTESEEHITIRRFGQQLKMQSKVHTEETEDGRLLSYTFELKNFPAKTSKSVGKVDGKYLTIESTIAGKTRTKKIPWDADIKSPAWQDRLLQKSPMKPGETRSVRTFMPEFSKIVDVRMSAEDQRPVKLHDQTVKSLLKIKVSQSILPGVALRVFVDNDGKALRTEADMMNMVTYRVPREIAVKEIAGEELDVATSTLVRPEKPAGNLHEKKLALYRVYSKGPNPFVFLEQNASQEVTADNGGDAEVQITDLRIEARRPPRNIQPSRKEQTEYLEDTEFLQTSDARVREHARKAAAGSRDPGTIAVRMEQYVYKELKKKNFSTALASAAEVADSLEGDCTEHACLLAAMLRVEKIPSRVAVGLVYSDRLGAFGGHMWTEAWLDGHWIPLDATLGKGGIGVGHIKVSVSGLADEGPAPVTSFVPLISLLSDLRIVILFSQE